jgi:uncharacterized protein YbaR (Trm112 family)
MALAGDLLSVLVDPIDHQSLHYFESLGFLYNDRTQQRYPISSSGIAILLADEAETVSDDEHARLLSEISNGKSIVTGTKV